MKRVSQRALGSQGLVCSSIGLGCMGMTAFYGGFNRESTEEESLKTIERAIELGVNLFDTAWIYQSFGADGRENTTNEQLLAKAIRRFGRDRFVIATKFGIQLSDTGLVFCGKPESIRSQLNDSLSRLGIDCIDLYYQHRMDPTTPIEETITCLKELINEGKIKYIGLSECTPNELRRAHKIHPITAIQMEYSLQTRDIEDTLLPVARELGVGIVAYSPLGRGLLTGKIKSVDDLEEKDWRRTAPRFFKDNLDKNLEAALKFSAFADKKGCTPAQLALSWMLSKGEDIFPIPGTKSSVRLIENIGAINVELTPSEIDEIEAMIPEASGDRYPNADGTYNTRL